jgi:spoIIIJ-associated protein
MMEEKLKSIIENFLAKIPFSKEEVVIYYDSPTNTYWASIKTADSRFFIGRQGEALSSLNHLVSKIIEKETKEADFVRVVVDVNDYRKKKVDNLKTLAYMLAERAKFFKNDIEADPMPAYERRIIHEYLADHPEVKTESTGYGDKRRVVIKYKNSLQPAGSDFKI